jgi:hypothetical protein
MYALMHPDCEGVETLEYRGSLVTLRKSFNARTIGTVRVLTPDGGVYPFEGSTLFNSAHPFEPQYNETDKKMKLIGNGTNNMGKVYLNIVIKELLTQPV